MIFTGGYDCEKCIHNKVCSLKKDVNKAQSAATEVFDSTNELIEITVRCKAFQDETLVRKFSGKESK